MPNRHNRFVHAENIRDFQRRLAAETDPEKRLLLEKLLAEENRQELPKPAVSPRKPENR